MLVSVYQTRQRSPFPISVVAYSYRLASKHGAVAAIWVVVNRNVLVVPIEPWVWVLLAPLVQRTIPGWQARSEITSLGCAGNRNVERRRRREGSRGACPTEAKSR
jgi:hypothetical protein